MRHESEFQVTAVHPEHNEPLKVEGSAETCILWIKTLIESKGAIYSIERK